jgi:hypothetical protein
MFFISLGRFLVFGPSWHGRCNMSCEPDESSSTNPNQTLRRIIMLTIKDLAVSKSLGCKEMSAVRGGFSATSVNAIGGQSQYAVGGGFLSNVSPVQVGSTLVSTPTNVALSFDTKSISNVLGEQKALQF